VLKTKGIYFSKDEVPFGHDGRHKASSFQKHG